MNTIYLIKDEKKDFALFKVGFASALRTRLYAYTTHNPLAECISSVKTQAKSGRKVEKMFHNEIVNRGYDFVVAKIDGKKTEWFKVDYNDPFYNELNVKGLKAFQCGKKQKKQRSGYNGAELIRPSSKRLKNAGSQTYESPETTKA